MQSVKNNFYLLISMVKIVLDIRKSAAQNAEVYFESAKKAKKKIEGARIALQKAEVKLDLIVAEHEEHQEKKKAHVKVKRNAAWYEKFRWFVSSEGFLCVGGRDATTNEIIIKKHAQKEDFVCHTDMSGSPFFVIKSEGNEPGDATLQEGVNATFSFSRALKLGLYTARTFWVRPDQVTKEANSGEYLSKGAFMIRGKTNYLTPQMDLAIGITAEGAIMCGPAAAIAKNTEKHLVLEAMKAKTSDTAKKIRQEIGGELDDIIRALPPGEVGIKKDRDTRKKAKR